VPANPVAMLGWLNRLAPAITPKSVLDALREEASPLDHPAIRYSGKAAPLGGEAALIRVFAEARTAKLPKIAPVQTAKFAYTDFGQPGYVVEDKREPLLGVRQVRFANNLRLNLKHTDLVKDQILVHVAVDGGRMLATRDNPLAVELVPLMGAAGLGKHSNDELQSILAGHVVGRGIGAGEESFLMRQLTRREDLELQLQLMTAQLTDPGYRPEAERDYRARINAEFARARSTPGGALGLGLGGILSDNDPRFTVPSPEVLKGLTFAKLRQDISDRLAHGAIEMGIVGDIDEDATIALVARTLGALPAREAEPRPYTQERLRSFTTNTAPRTLTHEGPADQALIHIVWRTRDDRDPVEKQALNMMDRVLRIMLTETLRQKLGKTYSTSAGSAPSRVWTDYGIFSIDVPVNVADVAVARAATFEAVGALRDAPPSDDMMLRARAPLLETLDSTLKTNLGWLAQAEQAQSKPGEIERQLKAAERLRAVTPAQVQAEARKYLAQANAVVVTVLPNSPPPTLPLAKPSEAKPSEAKPAPAP
jgi:zinc protease